MATDIVVPTLGESVTEATVAQWLKQPGDEVAADEPLVELETDKVTLEVNASEAGVLSEIVAEEGANVEVGALLGRIGAAGEGAAAPKAPAKSDAPAKSEAPARSEAPAKTDDSKAEPQPAAAARGNGAAEAGGDGPTLDLVVPTLGESVTEATVAQWLKQPGDSVAADEPLVELETDKVTLEVNAPADGVLQDIQAESGATVEVGALLGRIAAGTTGGATAPAAKPSGAKTPAEQTETLSDLDKSEAGQTAAAGPAGLDPSKARHGAPGGKIGKDDLLAFLQGGAGGGSAHGELSPAVRKLVAEKGLDAAQIPGSGKDGRITKEDVQRYMAGEVAPLSAPAPAAAAKAAATPAAAKAPEAKGTEAKGAEAKGAEAKGAEAKGAEAKGAEAKGAEERVKMSRLRRTIADRLKEAQNTAAILTTFNEIDMSAVMALRSEYRDAFEKKHGVKLGFTSFFTKAVVAALKEIKAVNGEIDGDEIVYKYHYDIGMAVSTPSGLMVPVVRDCDSKSFAEIEKTLGELAAKGRDGKLSLEEMQGGTFTITNGGVFGSLLSTPILNRPQSAILGLHKIEERPIAMKGEVVVRPMMYVALSYDHRIIDGREAVTFLVRVKENMEDPQRMLLDM